MTSTTESPSAGYVPPPESEPSTPPTTGTTNERPGRPWKVAGGILMVAGGSHVLTPPGAVVTGIGAALFAEGVRRDRRARGQNTTRPMEQPTHRV